MKDKKIPDLKYLVSELSDEKYIRFYNQKLSLTEYNGFFIRKIQEHIAETQRVHLPEQLIALHLVEYPDRYDLGNYKPPFPPKYANEVVYLFRLAHKEIEAFKMLVGLMPRLDFE